MNFAIYGKNGGIYRGKDFPRWTDKCALIIRKKRFSPLLYIFVSADKQYLRTQKQEEPLCD